MIPGPMYADLKRAGEIGIALALFAESIYPGGEFKYSEEGKQWIYRPYNFVTFHVQSRQPIIVLSLSGRLYLMDLAKRTGLYEEWLTMEKGMGTYGTYRITSPRKLLPAAQFIKWASDYYKEHGRHRVKIRR